MIAVLIAEGFEEIEALCPVDIMRRAGLDVKTVGICERTVTGSHGITVVCDITAKEINVSDVDHVIFPGGMPGATNLDSAPISDKLIGVVLKKGGIIGAICAAPLVLGRRGLLSGKRAICFPGFENELKGAIIESESEVVTDGQFVTACGMEAALPFAKELTKQIKARM